jgi:enoyl-CoA hydratase
VSRLSTERHDATVVLRLDAPARRNALDLATMRDLAGQLRAADADPEVRAIVLTGADPAFCAGLDLEAVAAGELVLEEVEALDADPWKVLQELGTPTIAAVNGPAVTGGLELVLCCDLAIASDQARFADTHARVGIHPSGGLTVLLPALRRPARRPRHEPDRPLRRRRGGPHDRARQRRRPHDALLPAAMQTAAAIAETDPRILQALLADLPGAVRRAAAGGARAGACPWSLADRGHGGRRRASRRDHRTGSPAHERRPRRGPAADRTGVGTAPDRRRAPTASRRPAVRRPAGASPRGCAPPHRRGGPRARGAAPTT